MSGKPERADSPGGKILQKARSFKQDLKSRIRRTPSASRAEKESSPSRKSHQQAIRKKVGRTISFNEGSKTDADAKTTADAICLDQDGTRVFNAIKYLRDVVTKGVLEQLSGATNIVLESVAEILQSVNKYFINQESTLLTSLSNQVYLNLANLIKWADQSTLDKSMDPKSVHKYVDPLEKGIKELLQLSKEKLQCREVTTSKTLQRPPGHRKASSTERTSSVPEPVPLTAEEIKILNQRTVLLSGASQNNSCYSNGDNLIDDAPPKPPLPQTFKLKSCPNVPPPDEDDVFASDVTSPDDTPPPLPVKHKSRVNSSYDNTDGKDFQIPAINSQTIQAPESLPLASQQPADASSGSSSSQDVTKLSPQEGASAVTPRSQSPTSSMSSARSGSSVEYLLDRSTAYTPQLDVSIPEQRLSHYDNNYQPWQESASNCDKNTIQGMISQTIAEQITSNEATMKSLVHTSVHTSTYDSGIYDNKDFSSVHSDDRRVVDQPPPLPDKKNKHPSVESSASLCAHGQRQRVPSMYDNVAEELASRADLHGASTSNTLVTKTQTVSSTEASGHIQKQFVQNVERTQAAAAAMRAKNSMDVMVGGHHFITNSSTVSQTMQFTYLKETFSSDEKDHYDVPDGEPPPLPPKKRHVETYMQIFGHSPGLTDQELTRRSVRSMHFYHEQWQQHQMELFMPTYRRSNTFSVKPTHDQSRRELYSAISSSFSDSQRASDISSVISGSSSEDGNSLQGPVLTVPPAQDTTPEKSGHIPELPVKQRSSDTSSSSGVSSRRSDPTLPSAGLSDITEDNQLIKESSIKTPAPRESKTPSESLSQPNNDTTTTRKRTLNNDTDSAYSEIMDNNILDEVDVSKYLVRKKENEDGPDLRGGSIDALIVHATTTGKNDFMYQEAFLTTYRTMITSHDLVEKLIYRYNRFSRMNDIKKKKLSRNAFSLLTRVVNELCTEVDEKLIEMLMSLVFQMLCDGELTLARVLRSKVLEKCHYLQKRREANQQAALWPQYKLSTRQYTMFHFKSQDIAEQMTLLDAELFQKIEIPEVLLWAKEQVEEHSPNLTKFTEHFNKMSYWCRTRILEQEDPKDREHCFVKFIKIMRYLEKFNNFNSYLAILSALSSSPLARLDWQKQNADTLAQYFSLIDNTHGFRTYRQRLSETEPPCIPYIGLILQDLTFVHVGNKDWLSENIVNFTKRWQQFNILDNMRRFRKCNYEFTKKEKIISFFNNFDNYLPEETLWQISEAIKPPKRTLYR